jgi:TonB family protein
MQAVIGIDGLVSDIKVLSSSNPMFNDAAVRATSQRMFRPALQDGKPVAIQFTIRTDFRLR